MESHQPMTSASSQNVTLKNATYAEDDKLNLGPDKSANVLKVNYKWTVHNISMQKDRVDKSIKSNVFYSHENLDKAKWRLIVYPKGFNQSVKDHWSVFVQLQADSIEDKESIPAHVKMSLIKRDKTEANVKTFEHCFNKDKTSKGFLKFIRDDQLMDRKIGYIDNDAVTINLQISMRITIDVPKCTFLDNIAKLIDDPTFSDYTILFGEKELRVHKVILATHSTHFTNHFLKNPFEPSMAIDDMDPKVGDAFFNYLYTCQLPNTNEPKFSDFNNLPMIFGLLNAANKYKLDHLKGRCEQRIVASMTDLNCCEILNLCDNSDTQNVKKYAIVYITSRAQDVMKTEGWKQLRPNMLNEIFKTLAEKNATTPAIGKP